MVVGGVEMILTGVLFDFLRRLFSLYSFQEEKAAGVWCLFISCCVTPSVLLHHQATWGETLGKDKVGIATGIDYYYIILFSPHLLA